MAPQDESEFEYVQSEGWKPKPGVVMEGEVLDISSGYSTYKDENYPILTIQPAEGEPKDVHCFHEVLRNKILQLRPQVGEKVGIKYLGKTKKKGNTKEEVATYIVRVKGRRSVDPYAAMSGAAAPPAPQTTQVAAEDGEDTPF